MPGNRAVKAAERVASVTVVDDIVLPFAVESLSTRGRLVRLGPAVDQLLKRHDYPEPVSKLAAEAVTLAALLGSTLKLEGRFQLQTKTDGPVSMLLVDFDAPSNLRALRAIRPERVAAAKADEDLLGRGHMAFTIDPGGDMNRYQGVIALEGQGSKAAHPISNVPNKFRRWCGSPSARRSKRAAALGGPATCIVQYLPGSTQRRADFHPGDAPEGTARIRSRRTTPRREAQRARRPRSA